ncbi:MAG: glutathione peroxidase, partial [Actinomycetota bacterium]
AEGADGDIRWNFEKFLVGRDGKVLARFSPRVVPDDAALVGAIESALG